MLWECFARSGGVRSGGYIDKIKEMWDGGELSVRSKASLISQLKQIEANGLLTLFKRDEIAKSVRDYQTGSFDQEVTEESVLLDNEKVEDNSLDFEVAERERPEARVILNRLDVWRSGEEVRALANEEKTVMGKLRSIFESDEVVSILSLKTQETEK